ncbi:hypothetical protein Ancab_000832 [Ancistrocladus abbreviatus]
MEEYKLRYLNFFLVRAKKHNLEDYVNVVKEGEEFLRESYAEVINLDSDAFVEMVLVDAAFIIELFSRVMNCQLIEDDDIIFRSPRMLPQVLHDLELEENQLPFLIIRKLYDFAFELDGFDCRYFLDITRNFFGNAHHELYSKRKLPSEPKRFVDFLRACYRPSSPQPEPVGPDEQLLCSNEQFLCSNVIYLHKAGVKIKPAENDTPLLDITFSERLLSIPKIVIQDTTESLWRNLMVFEQCHNCEVSYISDYLTLLDSLIDDAKDVQMLIEAQIIENLLGNNEDVSDLFRKLCKNIGLVRSTFYYRDICQQLNKHCSSKWHKHKATLRQKYFNHPWAALSVISAFVLLLLTVIQAITGVVSIIHK